MLKIREIQVSYRETGIEMPDSACDNSEMVAEIFAFLKEADREKLYALHLSSRMRVLGFELVSMGTTTESVVSPREIFKSVLKHNAVSIVLVHNHPSGNPKPSEDDKTMTRKVKQAASLLGIQLLDHIIIAHRSYFSFADEGIL